MRVLSQLLTDLSNAVHQLAAESCYSVSLSSIRISWLAARLDGHVRCLA
jgi:hypothetical protein